MPAPIATFIPDILEEHVEELAFLWEQRQAAVRDPRYTMRELTQLEQRITGPALALLAVWIGRTRLTDCLPLAWDAA